MHLARRGDKAVDSYFGATMTLPPSILWPFLLALKENEPGVSAPAVSCPRQTARIPVNMG